jgi:hypothetical protein
LKEFQGKKTFASSALNPKPRTVSFWYDQWRQKHLGNREGKSACEVDTITVLSEHWLINEPDYQMHIYGLFFSIVPLNSLLELGNGGGFLYVI